MKMYPASELRQIMKLRVFSLTVFFFLSVASVFFNTCYAYCQVIGSVTNYVSIGTITVPRSTPVGAEIARFESTTNSQMTLSCDSGGGTQYIQMTYNGAQPTSIPNVYKTNIPGLGITLNRQPKYYTSPPTSSYLSGPAGYYNFAPGDILTLVKTSDELTSGGLNTGEVGRVTMNGVPIITVYLTNGTINALDCTVSTSNLTFPIGTVSASKFGNSVGITPPEAQNTQNLKLNCSSQANIYASFSGVQNPDVSDQTVLALTNQGAASTAKGVGVQIVYNGSPLKIGQKIKLKTSSGGQESLPFTARYYQTKTAVGAGTANSTATLNLTYQ